MWEEIEKWATTAAIVILIALMAVICLVPIPLARGLWVWTVWFVFTKSACRFYGRRLAPGELDAAFGDDHGWSVLIPYSGIWRRARANLLRNMVLGE